jgi:hypothetical protein
MKIRMLLLFLLLPLLFQSCEFIGDIFRTGVAVGVIIVVLVVALIIYIVVRLRK